MAGLTCFPGMGIGMGMGTGTGVGMGVGVLDGDEAWGGNAGRDEDWD